MNTSIYKCEICQKTFEEMEIFHLNCNHIFCIICLRNWILNRNSNEVKCPSSFCMINISDKIIRELLSNDEIKEYDKAFYDQLKNCHQCIMPDCRHPVIYCQSNTQFECIKCSLFNCIACKASHKGLSCKEFQMAMNYGNDTICQDEMDRARTEYKKRTTKISRESIRNADRNILITNQEIFTCPICNCMIKKGMGIQLRQCFHNLCKQCLTNYVMANPSIPIFCPIESCNLIIEDRECRELLSPDELSLFERRSLSKAKTKLEKPDQCRLANCFNFVDIFGNVKQWTCLLCNSVNCIECDVIHNNQTCNEYQKINTKDANEIEEKIKKKELMRCPDCRTILQKVRGCNWIKCNNCNVELCWILQMYRWGPKGRGDTSGGCRCLVNGISCHAECRGCIPHG